MSRVAQLAEAMEALSDLKLGPDYMVLYPNWARWRVAMNALGYDLDDSAKSDVIDKLYAEVAAALRDALTL